MDEGVFLSEREAVAAGHGGTSMTGRSSAGERDRSAVAPLFDDGTRGATLSDDGMYRYDLWRKWAPGRSLGFVMLNPSVGDADVDDPTLRRCIGFARREGFAGIVVRNLFAFRTPKPTVLRKAWRDGADVVGPENDRWLAELVDRVDVPMVVAAWGAGPSSRRWNLEVQGPRERKIRQMFRRLHRFDDGSFNPAPHPLMLASDTPIERFS